MGDAVLRVQRHLHEFARDHFARQEAAHGANVDWLRAELAALSRGVGAALRRELKRPAPAVFRSNAYAFAAKRARVEEAPRTPEPTLSAPVSALVSAPVPVLIPAPVEVHAPAAPEVQVHASAVAVKKVVRRIRRVMRPKAGGRQRLDPVSMRVVELRAELKRRGLKAAGLKAVLVDRLLEAMEDDDSSDEKDDVVELEEVDEEVDEEVVEDGSTSPGREARDEIIRESIDLSQRSARDESFALSQSSEAGEARQASTKRSRSPFVSSSVAISEDVEETESTQGEDSQAPEASTSASEQVPDDSQDPQVPVPKHSADPIGDETDTSAMSLDTRSQDTVEVLDSSHKSSRATIAGESLAERKASLKVSFAAKRGDVIVPEAQDDSAHAETAAARSSSSEDPVTRLRSISLPQASVSTAAADPVTPNGHGTAGELLVARSEPGPGATDETEEERQKREHLLTIDREAQRLRIAAKLSAKKRFEEAMLSSSFWAKRDRLKTQQQQQQPEPVLKQLDVLAEDAAASPPKIAIKVEPEAEAATMNPSFAAASPSSDPSHTAQSTLKPEPPARSKEVKIPFSSSSRRFSDPSRRVSASRRRESASSRRDSTSSRRNSLTRRRDSEVSSMSSDSTKSSSGSQKTDAAAGSRKPTNLVSGLHSFTSLVDKESASASASGRSAPVVNALKMAEKSRLLEQKKTLEKTKRKEALMKKYEEQRKLDDDKKKKAMGVKEKAERDAKLKREQDKLNEKKQREIELAKRRHLKLQEMRAGLEKKRAMLAAEKQAGAAKLAAQAAATTSSSSSNRRTSTSSASTQAPRPAPAAHAPKPSSVAVSQVPTKQPAPSQPAHAPTGASKVAKPSAGVQLPKSAAPHSASAATSALQAAKAPPAAKERPTDTSTYDMSDNGESSEGDGDDSDDEDTQNKKNIPRWARKENLERILRVQFGPNASDPSPAIFPDFVDTCDLEAIFQPTDVRKKKRFQKRSSSGNWFGDRPTAREKAVYKRDMGYLR